MGVLSENSKNAIASLSKEELLLEINKGSGSRFQGEKYSYLKTRLAQIESEEQSILQQEERAHRAESISVARKANELSNQANRLSKWALFVAIVAAIAAIAPFVISMLQSNSAGQP